MRQLSLLFLICIPFFVNHALQAFVSEANSNNEWNISSLNTYETATNKNFKVIIDGQPFFFRVGRSNPESLGINRQLEITYYLIAEKLGIAPKLLAYHIDHGLLISKFIEGSLPTEQRMHQPDFIKKVIDNLHLLHSYRCTIHDIDTVFLRNESLLKSIEHLEIPLICSIESWHKYKKSFEKDYYQGIQKSVCHGDLFRGNFIETPDGALYIVDWEYSFYGYVIDDLGKLCSSNWYDEKEVEFIAQTYWKKNDVKMLQKLKQNIFMQQFNFFLWCHLQAAFNSEDNTTYLEIAKRVASDLNHRISS